ncbi:MAG: ubiquinone/menaquinone biosynthesis methyltransferase [Chloroflexota bacterium]
MTKGIQRVFSEVSHTYELVNHVLTFGLDILWRRKAAALAAKGGGARWIDMCSGTGEMAMNLSRQSRGNSMVLAADCTSQMLKQAMTKSGAGEVNFILADARALPFHDGTFDLITISFATRNINVNREALLQCLREFHRILKPEGRFVNLETSQPRSRLVRRLFHLYVRLVVRDVGNLLSGSRAGYVYLSNTIPRFYGAEEFADIIRQSGFAHVDFQRLLLGVTAIHKAEK